METKVNNICTPPLWSKNYLNPTPPQKGCLSSSVKLLVFCVHSISELGLAFFTVMFISPLASYVLRAGWRLSFQLVLKSEDLWDSGDLFLFYSPFSNLKVLGNLICSSVPPPVFCAWEISLCPAALAPTFSSLLLSTLCRTPMLREIPLSSPSLSPIYLYPM